MASLVHARNLGKTYARGTRTVQALAGVDLDIRAGESVAITGPSGSGKSTLMHILGCLDTPSTGHYLLAGEDVAALPDRELSRLRAERIGFVFQRFNLIPQLTILQNVALPFMYRTETTDPLGCARQALEKVGLGNRLEHRPAELSGGELQRAAIARSLVTDPLLILADEPTGNLDSHTAAGILDLFAGLHAAGATLAIVTHNPEVADICQRTLTLRDGMLQP
jgi:putative ABC transport system ATP-binding protein